MRTFSALLLATVLFAGVTAEAGPTPALNTKAPPVVTTAPAWLTPAWHRRTRRSRSYPRYYSSQPYRSYSSYPRYRSYPYGGYSSYYSPYRSYGGYNSYSPYRSYRSYPRRSGVSVNFGFGF